MAFSSDLRPFSVLSRIKAVTVLKMDNTKVEIRAGLLACHGVVLKWVHHCNEGTIHPDEQQNSRAWVKSYLNTPFWTKWDTSPDMSTNAFATCGLMEYRPRRLVGLTAHVYTATVSATNLAPNVQIKARGKPTA